MSGYRGGGNAGGRGAGGSYGGGGRGAPRGGGGGFPRGGGRAPTSRVVQCNTASALEVKDVAPRIMKETVFNAKPLITERMRPLTQYHLVFRYARLGEERVLTVDRDEDCNRNIRKATINLLFTTLLNQVVNTNDKKSHVFIYDRAQTLYTDFEFDAGGILIITQNFPEIVRADLSRSVSVMAEITPAAPVTENDPRAELTHYLEVLLQQPQFEDALFAFYTSGVFNFATLADFNDSTGLQLAKGHQKNVVHLEEMVNNIKTVLFLNPKQGLFHREGPLLQYLSYQFGIGPDTNFADPQLREKLIGFLKNVFVYPKYATEIKRFKVHGMSNPPGEIQFENQEGATLNVRDYIQERYGPLLYPKLPCVTRKFRTNEGVRICHYPMEVLLVIRGQRVSRGKMSNTDEANFIRACQLQPQQLMDRFEEELRSAHLTSAAPDNVVAKAGVRIDPENYRQDCPILFAPQIEYQRSAAELLPPGSEWRIERDTVYKHASTIKHLVFVHLGLNQNDTANFRQKLLERASQLGMRIERFDCYDMSAAPSNFFNSILDLKKKAATLDFVMLLGDLPQGHNNLKAAELYSPVVTQQVMRKTITNPKLGDVTITNVLNKMNLKAGGINNGLSTSGPQLHSLQKSAGNLNHYFFDGTMVFGLDKSSMGPISTFEKGTDRDSRKQLFTYGYAYTTTLDGNTTGGGYFYSVDENPPLSTDLLKLPLQNALAAFKKDQGKYPQNILYYRRGGDSHEALIRLEEEFGNITEALKQLSNVDPDLKEAGLLGLAVCRQHNVRLAQKDGSQYTNVQPGTIVNSGIVASAEEFVLIPHTSPLGTARPMKAIVIHDYRFGYPIKLVQQMTLNLCFNFEIVTKSINCPAPLRCAGQFAERGRNNYNTCKDDLRVEGNHTITREYAAAVTTQMKASIATRYNA